MPEPRELLPDGIGRNFERSISRLDQIDDVVEVGDRRGSDREAVEEAVHRASLMASPVLVERSRRQRGIDGMIFEREGFISESSRVARSRDACHIVRSMRDEPSDVASQQLPAPARSRGERRADVLRKLENDVDVWVASANARGDAHLIPLSFYWDGARLTVATATSSVTARNLARARRARMALGPTRDVVILEGAVEVIPALDDPELAALHAAAAGFDTRESSTSWIFVRMTPSRIQAWREENELQDRDVMRDGVWLE